MNAVPVPLDALPLGLLERRFPASRIALPSGTQVEVRTCGAVSASASASAPAVVLLHGIGSGAASWLQVALALTDAPPERRVIAWDAPGYGASTPLAAEAPTAADYAGRLGELLRAMQVEACVLVGHSLGALMAAAFASGAGRRLVQRLVLISPARGYGAPGQAEARQRVLAERSSKLDRLGIAGMAAEAPTRMLSMHADPAARAWVQWNAARLDAAGYRQAVRMLCDADLARFADLGVPVEVHCGDADAVTPPEACRAAAAALGAPFAFVAQAGHASPVEQPAAVARLIAGSNDSGDKTTMNDNPVPAEDGGDRYIVPALERGLKLLGEFSRENRRLGPPELARRLGLPRSTVFRLLNTLESLGFIERVDASTEYRLGMAVLRLGFEYLASLELTELGQPLLERLCDDLGVPCNLVVRDGRSIVYVAKVTPPTPLVSAVRVGTRLPAHATVLGRVLLEDLSLAELRRLYPEDHLEAFSPRTPKTVIELFDLVEHDRDRGFVVGEGFFEARISTVAAPVRDQSTRIIAALGATIPSDHVESDRIDDIVQRVRAAAEELSRRLNYRPGAGSGSTVVALRGRKAAP